MEKMRPTRETMRQLLGGRVVRAVFLLALPARVESHFLRRALFEQEGARCIRSGGGKAKFPPSRDTALFRSDDAAKG